ncbi:cupin domain-containing protein [cf. Phormidesmis sp. LEGE 11477]|uniref:cupin domain-containing protein n=1 Tax=cf. Phormidesmis sp. LEGE 11477 TaxID=1828680 RepID=UPI001880F516|nr:cupin domain-containing protein [cf. Phormidesmis sp. LEGE 11477]MBE9064660.1 cupin domain-containing protein [cf. Phormidesmis sp. LEGE 11477]
MNIQALDQIVQTLVPLDLSAPPDAESFRAAFCELGKMDRGSVSVGTWQGQTPWEYHEEGDEFLYVLSGQVALTLLVDGESKEHLLVPNSVFIVPARVWHRSLAQQPVTLLSVLASPHGPVSYAEDPRTKAQLVHADEIFEVASP